MDYYNYCAKTDRTVWIWTQVWGTLGDMKSAWHWLLAQDSINLGSWDLEWKSETGCVINDLSHSLTESDHAIQGKFIYFFCLTAPITKRKRRKPAMADPLDALRSLMAAHSPPLHALVVPSEDNHQVLFFLSTVLGTRIHGAISVTIHLADPTWILCVRSCVSVWWYVIWKRWLVRKSWLFFLFRWNAEG